MHNDDRADDANEEVRGSRASRESSNRIDQSKPTAILVQLLLKFVEIRFLFGLGVTLGVVGTLGFFFPGTVAVVVMIFVPTYLGLRHFVKRHFL